MAAGKELFAALEFFFGFHTFITQLSVRNRKKILCMFIIWLSATENDST
jgi:hypothetical protein